MWSACWRRRPSRSGKAVPATQVPATPAPTAQVPATPVPATRQEHAAMAFPSRLETGAQRAGRYKAAHAALEPGEASAAPAWAAVAKGCVEALGELPEGTNLGFVYATDRSEEHTSELQSLMRISYAVFCLKKKK